MTKTINGRTVLVTNMLRLVFALGCFVMNNPLEATSIREQAMSIHAEPISYKRLLLVYKEEYAKAGLVLEQETSDFSAGYMSAQLTFGFSNGGGRYLAKALVIVIMADYNQREPDGICSPCQTYWRGGAFVFDKELQPPITAAGKQAKAQVKAEVARIAKELSKDQKDVYKVRSRIGIFREVDNVVLTALLTRMGLTTRADLKAALYALTLPEQESQTTILAALGLPADLPADELDVLYSVHFSDPEPPLVPDPEAVTPPTIDYKGISHEHLISIYKKAFAKVGLTLGSPAKSVVGLVGTSTLLAFDFSGAGGQHLTDAVGIDVFSEGKPNDICSSCTAALLYIRTLDPELRSLIFAARTQAEAKVKAEVARTVKES